MFIMHLQQRQRHSVLVEIAKVAKITEEEAYLGIGWLFKEGKVKDENSKIVLA